MTDQREEHKDPREENLQRFKEGQGIDNRFEEDGYQEIAKGV